MRNLNDEYFLGVGKLLGASPDASRQKFSVFIAHKDRHGVEIQNIDTWIRTALAVLSRAGGGATSDRVTGAWLNPEGVLIEEPTSIVYTYIGPERLETTMPTVRRFLHDYGRETEQGEVAVLLEGADEKWFFRIDSFDTACR